MHAHTDQSKREAARLDALRSLDLLDTPPSEAFDRITRMAAHLFKLPIAAVSLTDSDRQWFKSRVGVEHDSIPRLKAPCAAVAENGAVLVVPDLLEDDGFRDSLLAGSGVRFYAGAPLTTREGYCLGAMCVLGTEPRAITPPERDALRDLAAMVMAQIELRHALGRIDPQSGLPNRNQFIDDLLDLQADRPRGEARVAAMLKLASPEQLSDALRAMGSAYLDEILGDAVRAVREAVGTRMKAYHVGSTDFAVIACPGTALEEFRANLAQWLVRRRVESNLRYVTTCSIGVAPFAVGEHNCHDVLRNLHSAAHDACAAGGGVRVFSGEQDALYQRRFWLINEFGEALASADQLRLVFQPKVDLDTGACVGAEALLRWNHPHFGEVAPAEFIPIIERTAMARAATAWVLEAAMRQLAAWQADGLQLRVAVNLAAVNLLETDFCERVQEGLARHGLQAASLGLEITESGLMTNLELAHATLARLAAAGVQLAIDDFGTGYSSLAYLQSLPANLVKIDRSFMQGIEHDGRRRALVATMVKLSHDLGHRVVAEGVETAEVAQVLRELACDQAQGYFYARPLAPQALRDWVAAAPTRR